MSTLRSKLEQNLGWFILIVLAVGCLAVIWPFLSTLVWAAILCFSSWPAYRRLLDFCKNRRTLAALVMTLALALVILLPFGIVGVNLADQVKDLTVAARKWLDTGPPAPPQWLQKFPVLGPRAAETWQAHLQDSTKFLATLRRVLEPASARLLALGVALGGGLIHLALSLVICFFLFRDGIRAANLLSTAMVRIGGDRAERLLNLAGSTIRGVVYGVLGTALIQAVLGGIGFLIAGIPGAAVLALFTLFLSVVPLGPALVALPGALWLYHKGSTGWAIFIMIWGLAVGSIDNFLKPWLISRGSTTPFLLILFGVLGGAITFGFIGVFLGPTLLAVGYRVFQEWLSERSERELTPAFEPPLGELSAEL
ncbi:MAG TPA: AI-2E family transporter [Verrucomicrobiae bacterium]|nr:AI-2E family transporter [Verrucomicrobiae bacterium]